MERGKKYWFILSFLQYSFERKGEKGGREGGNIMECIQMNTKVCERRGEGNNAECLCFNGELAEGRREVIDGL